MSIESDLQKAKSVIANDLAKATLLDTLDKQIIDLEKEIDDAKSELKNKMKELSIAADNKIKQQFKDAVSNTELNCVENASEIRAETNGLVYAVKFGNEERVLYKKLASKKQEYKFHYKRTGFIGDGSYGWEDNKGEENEKRAKIGALEKQLQQYKECLEKLEKEGLIVEYSIAQQSNTAQNSFIRRQIQSRNRENWTKIPLDGLLKLIF